ncbi:MAG: hypothetical protein WCW04_03510 [Candidatus Paceibacterota bacterium]
MKNNTESNMGNSGVNPIEGKGVELELGQQKERLVLNLTEISNLILEKKGQYTDKIKSLLSSLSQITFLITEKSEDKISIGLKDESKKYNEGEVDSILLSAALMKITASDFLDMGNYTEASLSKRKSLGL